MVDIMNISFGMLKYQLFFRRLSAWAIFPCRGALPKSLQDVNTRIRSEWIPNCKEYKLGGNYNIELYATPAENPEDTCSEIWVPIEKL